MACEVVGGLTELEDWREIDEEDLKGGEETGDEAEAAKRGLLDADTGDEESFGFEEPKEGPVPAVEAEGNRGEEQGRGEGREDEEGGTPARAGDEGEEELDDAERDERAEGPLGVRGLVLQQGEQASGVEDCRYGGDEFLAAVLRDTKDIEESKDEPIEEQQTRAGRRTPGMGGRAGAPSGRTRRSQRKWLM